MTRLRAPEPPMIATRWHGGDQDPVGGILRLHSTVSPCQPGQAKTIARYFQSTSRPASAHYVVDCSPRYADAVRQCVPDHKRSYDCGWNPPGLSIEMCEYPSQSKRRWDDKPHRQLEANAVELAAHLCVYYEIRPYFVSARGLRRGKKGVTTHAQVAAAYPTLTTHWDPGAWRRYRFMRALRKRVKQIRKASQ